MSVINQDSANYGPNQDLEAHQYETLYQEWDVPLLDIRKRYFQPLLIICSALLLLFILLANLVEIPNYLEIEIIIENQDKDQMVFFPYPVKAEGYLVELGDTLEKGQKICRISAPQIQALIAEIKSVEHDIHILDTYDAENVAFQSDNLRQEKEARQLRVEALISEKNASIALFHEEREALHAKIAYRKDLKEKDQFLLGKGAISEWEYLATERKYLDKLDELAILKNTYNQSFEQFKQRKVALEESLLTIEHQIKELEQSFKFKRNKLYAKLAHRKRNLTLHYGPYSIEEGEFFLLAAREGKLTYLYPDQELLETGDILYRLEVSSRKFIAKGELRADQIGYIKQAMAAKIMVETFPHYEWGSMSGKVKHLSKSPGEEGVFSIFIEIEEDNSLLLPLLQNGLSGKCSLIIEQKTLFSYALRRIKKSISTLIY
ncbi:MAG: hypothetical protein AAF696_22415 [Bacteroidota bacterium]